MARSSTSRRNALVFTGVLVAVLSGVLVGGTAVAAPKRLRVACALVSDGTLRYVARPSACRRGAPVFTGSVRRRPRRETIVRFVNRRVDVCIKRPPAPGERQSARFSRLPVGSTRHVSNPSECAPPGRRNEVARSLPADEVTWFCARRPRGRLRWVGNGARRPCRRGEFSVFVPARSTSQPGPGSPTLPGPGNPVLPGPGNPVPALNQPPSANDDSATTGEDVVRQIDVLANDTDPEGNSLTIASTDTTGTQGTVTVSANRITYDPGGAFNGLKPGESATDSFKYRASDGTSQSGPATVTVTITGANDAPVIHTSSGATSTTEGAAATDVDAALTVTDPDDTSLEGARVRISSSFESGDELVFVNQSGITGAYNTGTGVLSLTGTASKADYQTALRSVEFRTINDNPATSKTVEFKANDGDVDSAAATKNVSVAGSNDPPALNTTNANLTYRDGDGAVAVDSALTAADPDSTNLSGATVQITSNFSSAEDDLAFTNQSGITGAYNDATGTLTLTGTTTVANYQQALRSVTYENSSQNPSTATRTVSFQATDDASAASNVATRGIAIAAVNDAPTVNTSAGTTSYTEGAAATDVDAALTVTDPDDTSLEGARVRISSSFESGDELVFVNQSGITGAYNTGTGVLSLTGTASKADYQTALRSVEFRTINDNPAASKAVAFRASDGDDDGAEATKNVSVAGSNDGPTLNTTNANLTYREGDGAVAVDSALTAADPDSTNLSGATVQITSNFSSAEDDLAFTNQSGITGAYNDATGTLTLTGTTTVANYQQALRSVTYENSSQNPSTATRTVSFRATDDASAASNVATRGIAVAAVNDAPVNAVPGAQTVDEDTNLTFSSGTANAISVSDADAGGGDVRVTLHVDHGAMTLATTTGLSFTAGDGAGDPTMTFEGTLSEVNAALSGAFYRGDLNYAGPDQLDVTTNDLGRDGGPAESDSDSVDITVNPVNDAPSADDETFNGNDSAHGNTTMIVNDPDDGAPNPSHPKTTVSGDILAGDTDADGPGPLTVTPGTFATNDGGSVTIESDGDFTFHPAASTSCTDTSDFFDYTVEDSGSPELTDTGRVTIAIAGCVWYVDNNNASANSGTSSAPFDTLQQAETASGGNHTVFVFDGNNTPVGYHTGFAMNSGERLIGEHEGLVVDPDQGGGLNADTLHPANAGAHPTLTALNEDVVELDDGNEVRGFNVDPQGTGGGIAGASGDSGGGTIDDVNVNDTTVPGADPGLELDGTTGTFNITNLAVDNSAAISPPNTATGIRLNNAGTTDFGSTTITITSAAGLAALNTNLSTSAFDAITVSGSDAGGVSLTNLTGTTSVALGDGIGGDLDITTTGGAAAGLFAANVDGLSVGSAGTDDIHAAGGPAVDVNSVSGAQLNFDDVDSTNSLNEGINIDGLGNGTFTNATGDIGGYGGIGFDVNGGSGIVTNRATLNDGTGTTAVRVTGRTGGTVTHSAPLNDTNDNGGGIVLNGNTGGATTFNNPTKQLNTGANDGVTFTNSDGHTLNLFAGNLDIDTTTGKGLDATTSGTVAVTGSDNTIDTGNGRALNVSNTDIGNSDLTFRRISSNGAANGIRLNNTGNAVGRLFLTGNGGTCDASAGTCTGGAIENSTGPGVELNDVPGGAELMRLAVTEGGSHGIQATGVSGGILLDRSFLNSNGNAVNENGLEWSNVTGVTAIRHSDVIGSGVNNDGGWNARIINTSGTLHLTVNDNDFNLASTEDGLQIQGGGTATIRTNITGNRFDDNKGDAFQVADQVATGVTSDHTFTGNTIDGRNGTATDGGVAVSTDGSSRVTIDNNTVTNVSVSGIILNPVGSSAGTTADMTASSNSIGTAGVQASGSEDGDGMQLKSASDGTSKISMSNNNVRGWQGAGMRMRASETNTNASTHLTAQSNTIGDEENDGVGGVAATAGIYLQAGSGAADVLNMCANVGGAGGLANTLANPPVNNDAIADFVLDLRFANSTMRLPGYTGTTVTDRQNYFLGRNSGFTTFAQDGLQNPSNEADGQCDQPTASPTPPTAPPAVGP